MSAPMRAAQHTPGPWQIIRQDGVDNCYLIRRRYETGGVTNIALVNILARQFEVGDLTLIAAAPDLLAALERLTFAADCRESTMGDPCGLLAAKAELSAAAKAARVAIAAARNGGQS